MSAPAAPPPAVLPPEQLAFARALSEQSAELVAPFVRRTQAWLEEAGKSPLEYLPLEFLLELGAVLLLQRWERAGLRAYLEPHLPAAREAGADLSARFRALGPDEFRGYESDLAARVLWVGIQLFAWAGPERLRADLVLVVDESEVDQTLRRLADFLWDHRHGPAQGADVG